MSAMFSSDLSPVFVPVAKFRLAIAALEKLFLLDKWNRGELKKQFNTVFWLDCKRKKPEDQQRKDAILNQVSEHLGFNLPMPEKVEAVFNSKESGFYGRVLQVNGPAVTMLVDGVTFTVSKDGNLVTVHNHSNKQTAQSDCRWAAVCIAVQRTLETPIPPTEPSEVEPEKTGKVDPVRAERFEKMAEKLQSQIDAAFAERLTNTPKRIAEAGRARAKGEHLKRVQAVLLSLAGHHAAGTCPEPLKAVKTKKDLEGLLVAETEVIHNGFHDYYVDSGRPRHSDPVSLAAWALLKPKSDEALKDEALQRKINDLQFAKIAGFFPTPDPVLDRLFQLADIKAGGHFIEPSAGAGNIADRICQQFGASLELYEVNYTLVDILEKKGFHVGKSDKSGSCDFLQCERSERADYIIMNPPFENLQDVEHVQHAYSLLKQGGVLVSVMSPSAFFRSGKKSEAFRAWFVELGGYKEALPAGSFKVSGTNVDTVIIKLVKPVCNDSPVDSPAVETGFLDRQEARKERYEYLSASATAKSNALFSDAQKMADAIPFGQPILVGHHSEKSDRAYRSRFIRKFDQSFQLQQKADYYAGKVDTVGNGGISSIDPDALVKLQAKLLKLETLQSQMKAVNAAIRKGDDQALKSLGYSDSEIEIIKKPDTFGNIGFARYKLTNNNAEIKRLKNRVAEIKKLRELPDLNIATDDYKLTICNGRVVFDFDLKPDESIRKSLRSHGFTWSRSSGAWVRKCTANAVASAMYLHSILSE